MVAFLENLSGSFKVSSNHSRFPLNRSHICYALTKKPAISVSFIKQFWRSAEASTNDNGEVKIIATIDDQGSSEKGSVEVSTAGATKGTASEVPVVSTAEENLSTAGRTVTYTRRSEEKRKRQDKGKAIMIESEPKKKSKKELEQERLSFAEAIRLEEQMNEEQRAQIARDEEIARQ
ncbi:hypothetical protein Tco_0937358 [Tanacetum coccineum]|uniref:Uncharacterized protein n=1 Tax=Tanacetum coccineum TaxID=301880 RepID=A0ABQ5DF04_9ASTR